MGIDQDRARWEAAKGKAYEAGLAPGPASETQLKAWLELLDLAKLVSERHRRRLGPETYTCTDLACIGMLEFADSLKSRIERSLPPYRFGSPEHVEALLRLIVQRKVGRRTRTLMDRESRGVRSKADSDLAASPDFPTPCEAAEDSRQLAVAINAADEDLLDAALASLDEADQAAIQAEMMGLSHQEIGEELGISIEASRSRRRASHARLREALGELAGDAGGPG